ncbi:cytochrome P450 [Streptomyces sp. NBC_01218]|uniref:cytochrome P450 family protein n=1 Tax=unclassified Streptomyces TaxID=2593676 RepID=UPI0023B9D683|nr:MULTISPECIES: cytochrome P450 [unclassified Streptomyces]WEH38851.1 cytochrome P450 [Streptomyces sp. AM 2-1-1]WSQ50514.1 cytochrome P450 [Streptomyces sp. NBC_01218]
MTTDAILDLGALGEDFTRDPYPVYAALRARGPVHRVVIPDGTPAWLVVGYEAGRELLADQRLSKDWANASPLLGAHQVSAGRTMLSSDAPDHTRLRTLVSREFTPRRIQQLAPRIQRMADELLDAMLAEPDRRTDLVDALSFPLPMAVICELLGVPTMDRQSFREWSNTALSSTDAEERRTAVASMNAYIAALLDDKRKDPGTDLMSALIHTADEEGDRLSGNELAGMAWLLLVAGHETTVNLISNGVLHLLTHPDQLAALRDRPGLLGNAVEEILRYDGPVETPTYRFTTAPLTVGSTVIPGGGELVLVAMADANRDPARFEGADRFDITRDARGHVAFGHGIHYCLGAPLARVEARAAIGSLLARCPDLRLDTDPELLTWRTGMLIRGPERLPVAW